MAARRFSRQREQIYQAVCAAKTHPSAQMVYDDLKKDLPKLSLGTVYRNLHQMAEEGTLVELDGPVARFDAITVPHTHIRCERCGGRMTRSWTGWPKGPAAGPSTVTA